MRSTAIPILALAVAFMAPAGSAGAQVAGNTQAGNSQASGPAQGVIEPPRQIDRGMTRKPPDMPAQSTPVIHPPHPARAHRGKMPVVPKPVVPK